MRRFYWSIPALLLVGAGVWAQQRSSDVSNPARTPESRDLPARIENNADVPPAVLSTQTYPAATRTIRTDSEGRTTFDSGVIAPGGGGLMMSSEGMSSMGSSGSMMMGGMSPGPMKARQVQRTLNETQYVPMTPEEAEELNRYQNVVAKLRSDRPEAEKEQARQALQELLSTGFDRDLQTREGDLKGLESRVQKLRTQLEKRKAAKQEIIDLRLKTIQNEADGLEYPGAATPPAGELNQPVPGLQPGY